MAHHLNAEGFPNIPLTDGMILKLEARSATTDAQVSGVTCSLWAIYGDNLNPGNPFAPDTVPSYTAQEA